MDHTPLFSPSQVPAEEKVLTSIFTPAFSHGFRTAKLPDGKNQMECSNEKQLIQQEEGIVQNERSGKKPEALADEFFSPVSASVGEDYFLSITPDVKGFSSPFSKISPLSYNTCASSGTLPIDCLSLDFVKNCQSAEELERVISVLTLRSPRNYPSLVRVAKKQLNSVSKKDASAASIDSPLTQESPRTRRIDSPKEARRKVTFSKQKNEEISNPKHSSLNYSYSPPHAMEENANWLPCKETEGSSVSERMSSQESTLALSLSSSAFENVGKEELAIGANSSRVVGADRKLSGSPSARQLASNYDDARSRMPRSAAKSSIAKDVGTQTHGDRTLETTLKSENDWLHEKIKKVHDQLTVSAGETKDLTAALTNARLKSHELRHILLKERETAKMDVALLRNQVATAKMQFRRTCQSQQLDISMLQQSLQETQTKLDSVRKERSQIIHSLLNALGKYTSLSKINCISDKDRSAVLQRMAKKVASSRAASKALAESLAMSENERRIAIEARDEETKRFQEANRRADWLERTTKDLTEQIELLTTELGRRQHYIDKLLKSTNAEIEQKTLSSREADHKKITRQLRERRSIASVLPYQEAEGKSGAQKCERGERHGKMSHIKMKAEELSTRPSTIARKHALSSNRGNRKVHEQTRLQKQVTKESRPAERAGPESRSLGPRAKQLETREKLLVEPSTKKTSSAGYQKANLEVKHQVRSKHARLAALRQRNHSSTREVKRSVRFLSDAKENVGLSTLPQSQKRS